MPPLSSLQIKLEETQRQLQQAERQALLNLGQAWQREDITRAERDAAIERAEAAETLARQRGRALLAIRNSVSKGEMRRIAIQAAPAEAQEGESDD